MKKSSISIGSLSGQPRGPPIGEEALGECIAKLSIPSFVEGLRMAEDKVQSLLQSIDILRICETNLEAYMHGAFQLVIR